MTRKKAIERAMKRLREESLARAVFDENGRVKYEGSPLPGSVQRELSAAYDEGLIAGARKAIGWLPSEGALRAWDTKRKLRARAAALAKKARKNAK